MTTITAHRGSSGTRPENTLPSFAEAVRQGADSIELDVHLTKDQQLVVIHDETVNRTTNGKGLVRDLTVAQIKRLDAGSWYDRRYHATKIPLLKEVLDLLLQLRFRGVLNIEIKTDKYEYPRIEELLSRALLAKDWSFDHLYSSFNIASLARIHVLEPDTELALILSTSEKKIKLAQDTEFIRAIHPSFKLLKETPERLDGFTKLVRPWTINQQADMQTCYRLRLAGIITDFPETANRVRKGRNE